MGEVIVLKDGFSYMKNGGMYANCTCSLIKTPKHTIIFDTMSPWDGPFIVSKLKELEASKIDYVISSHGHTDHIGNNNLFLDAKHIVGFCYSFKDEFFLHPFEQGVELVIDEWCSVVPTPGHTAEDVSLRLKLQSSETVFVSGDLFESESDIENPSQWLGNSASPHTQSKNRLKVLKEAQWIVPGHGPMFKVRPNYIEEAQKLVDSFDKELESTLQK